MSEPSNGPEPATAKTNSRQRRRRKPSPENKNPSSENTDREGTPTGSKAPKRKSNKSRSKPKTKKDDGSSNKTRLLESVKLMKRHFPATINGVAVSKIIARAQAENGTEPQENASKKDTGPILADHLESILAKNPEQSIYLSFVMRPSDPDFPYDLESLNFNLSIPYGYPRNKDALPSIVVLNTNIPRGFSVNIESGFRSIAKLAKGIESPDLSEAQIQLVNGSGLRSQVDTLNKHLEYFLSKEKKQTVKFITFKGSPKNTPSKSPTPSASPAPQPRPTAVKPEGPPVTPTSKFTKESLHQRSVQVSEMCSKLSDHIKLFNESKTESRYKVAFPVGKDGLPTLWTLDNRSVDVFLTIPAAYPLEPPRAKIASNYNSNLIVAKKKRVEDLKLSLMDVVSEAKAAEKNFNDNAGEWHSGLSLVQYLNLLHIRLSSLVAPKAEFEGQKLTMEKFRQTIESR